MIIIGNSQKCFILFQVFRMLFNDARIRMSKINFIELEMQVIRVSGF